MTDKGKMVYERLKNECLPYIHKLSNNEKKQILEDNKITTNLPHSYWKTIQDYYSDAAWEDKIVKEYPEHMESKSYLFLRTNDEDPQQIEYFSVLYNHGSIYAEMGVYYISDFPTLCEEVREFAEFNERPFPSNLEIIKEGYNRNVRGIDLYKRDRLTYSVNNPYTIEETLVTAEQLQAMVKAVNIDESEIEPPAKAKQGVYER